MAKRTNKISISKCKIEFRDGIAYLIEHKKSDDVEFLFEDLVEEFKEKDNISVAIGTDLEI